MYRVFVQPFGNSRHTRREVEPRESLFKVRASATGWWFGSPFAKYTIYTNAL